MSNNYWNCHCVYVFLKPEQSTCFLVLDGSLHELTLRSPRRQILGKSVSVVLQLSSPMSLLQDLKQLWIIIIINIYVLIVKLGKILNTIYTIMHAICHQSKMSITHHVPSGKLRCTLVKVREWKTNNIFALL